MIWAITTWFTATWTIRIGSLIEAGMHPGMGDLAQPVFHRVRVVRVRGARRAVGHRGGLFRGLRHADAARFAFLLATPVILAAGVVKLPTLFTPANHAVLGPALAGSLVAGVASYIAVRFLTSYFETRTLTPFAIYRVLAGVGSLTWLTR